jgi:uncharacterized membrane protein
MINLIKAGRLFYGLGITAYGSQQIIIKDFRPEMLPPFPAWAHRYVFFSFITGAALIFAGIVIADLFTIKGVHAKKICLYVGVYFLVLLMLCHLPYTLILSPNRAYHLGVWAEALKELAFCGGAFVMAGSFSGDNVAEHKKRTLESLLEKIIPLGSIFFSTTMILYGCSHFVYTDYIAPMVPKWFGMPVFWTYFGGVALIGSGIAIVFRIWIKTIAMLLAIMLFLWFIIIHIPGAIAHPYVDNGNLIVSAFDALLFCGVALVISVQNRQLSKKAFLRNNPLYQLHS